MYAKELTHEYLETLGITYVSPSGEIYKGDKEIKPSLNNEGYYIVTLYDPAIKLQVSFGVHRITYAWWNKIAPEGLVVHHNNFIKTDNNIFNLSLRTSRENICMERDCDRTEIKCNLNRPRTFYEDKLKTYTERYNQAKLDKDAELVHKLRSNIYQCRARLRYYDSHIEEAMDLWEAEKARQYAAELRDYYKSINDPIWHNYAKLSKIALNSGDISLLFEHHELMKCKKNLH